MIADEWKFVREDLAVEPVLKLLKEQIQAVDKGTKVVEQVDVLNGLGEIGCLRSEERRVGKECRL